MILVKIDNITYLEPSADCILRFADIFGGIKAPDMLTSTQIENDDE